MVKYPDTEFSLYSRLHKANRALFELLLKKKLSDLRRVSFLVEERLTNPRVRSKSLTEKLIKRYENLSNSLSILFKIEEES